MKNYRILFSFIFCFSGLLGYSQVVDSLSQLTSYDFIKLAESSLINNDPQKAIEYVELHEQRLKLYKAKGQFICGNGAASAYIKKLTIKAEAYFRMGKYELVIDNLLPLAFDESISSLAVDRRAMDNIFEILANAIKARYSDLEIKNEFENCREQITSTTMWSIGSHNLKIFNRDLRLYLMEIHKTQIFIKKRWSEYYSTEYESLSENERNLSLEKVTVEIENYVLDFYENLIRESEFYHRLQN